MRPIFLLCFLCMSCSLMSQMSYKSTQNLSIGGQGFGNYINSQNYNANFQIRSEFRKNESAWKIGAHYNLLMRRSPDARSISFLAGSSIIYTLHRSPMFEIFAELPISIGNYGLESEKMGESRGLALFAGGSLGINYAFSNMINIRAGYNGGTQVHVFGDASVKESYLLNTPYIGLEFFIF